MANDIELLRGYARKGDEAAFTELARKAARLCERDELVGWLFVSTPYAALKLLRSEARRAIRDTGMEGIHGRSNRSGRGRADRLGAVAART